MEAYERLTANEVDDYGALKAELLKRFCLTEGAYRGRNSSIPVAA